MQKVENMLLRLGFSLVVLLSAFLLFILEPLVGKIVTPGFGGTSGVWSACLLFFQLALLSGYLLAYSLALTPVKVQSIIYAVILIASALLGHLAPPNAWVCNDFENPIMDLFRLLVSNLALPFMVLSSTSVVMQVWYRFAGLGNPYPLYSLSNIGSLSALLAFPLLLEPMLTISDTEHTWTAVYLFLAVLGICLSAATFFRKSDALPMPSKEVNEVESDNAIRPSARDYLWWFFLSACGSIALLAFTTYITLDVSPIPLFWIMPLAVYLLSFILLFGYPQIYKRKIFAYVWTILWLSEIFVRSRHDLTVQVALNLCLLFAICMVFHGELVDSRPAARFLPGFYLAMAAGGALGGIFVNFIAPSMFAFYWERFLIIDLLAVVTIILVARGRFRTVAGKENQKTVGWDAAISDIAIATMAVFCIALSAVQIFFLRQDVVAESRNFYGSIRIIKKRSKTGGVQTSMVHGVVVHGREIDGKPGIKWEPGYVAFSLAREGAKNRPLNCAVVGLGVGQFAIFGKDGDTIRYFELDPKVGDLARDYFSFLRRSHARVSITTGDGRLTLAQEPKDSFDLIFLDAFNGNAIPVHLLTTEAMQVYLDRLRPHGILGFNVSNRYLDLVPVLGNLARDLKLTSTAINVDNVTYVLLSRDAQIFNMIPEISESSGEQFTPIYMIKVIGDKNKVWSDDYANLLPYIRKRDEE